MVDLSYKHVVRLLDLVDEKISDLEDAKTKDFETKRAIPFIPTTRIGENPTEDEVDQPQLISKYDKDIREFQSIRDKIDAELSKLNFKFGSGEDRK